MIRNSLKKIWKSILKLSFAEKLLVVFLIVLPLQRLLTLEVSGFTLKLSYAIGLIMIVFFGIQILLRKNKLIFYWEEIILFIFAGLSLLTIIWSIDLKRSIIVTLWYCFMFAIFWVIRRLVKLKKMHFYLNIIFWLGIVSALFAIWQFITGSFDSLQGLSFLRDPYAKEVFGFPRVHSTFLEPLYFANFLIFPLFIGIYKTIKKINVLHSLALILMSTVLYLTLSRGAMVAFSFSVIAFLILYVILFKKYKKAILVFCLILISASAALGIAGIFSTDGTEVYLKQTSTNEVLDAIETKKVSKKQTNRDFTYTLAFEEFKKNPEGIGIGAFGALPEFERSQHNSRYQIVNNLYLEILVEQGIAGLVIFCAFLVLVFLRFFSFLKKRDLLGVVMTFAILTLFIQYNTFSNLGIIYIWVFIGLYLGYSEKINSKITSKIKLK